MAKRETINGLAAALLRIKAEILYTTQSHWLVRIPDGDVQCLGVWDEQAQTLELLDGPAMLDAVLATRRPTITLKVAVDGAKVAAAAIEKVATHARHWVGRCPINFSDRTATDDGDTWCRARRQKDGLISVSTHPYLTDAEAASLRDQLDVALHVPAPEQPINPPSRL